MGGFWEAVLGPFLHAVPDIFRALWETVIISLCLILPNTNSSLVRKLSAKHIMEQNLSVICFDEVNYSSLALLTEFLIFFISYSTDVSAGLLAWVRAGDNVREKIEVPTVGFCVWMRCPAPGHTRSGTNCHAQGTLPSDITDQTITLQKISPGKRKPAVIFVAVLRAKVHQIKGCFSVLLQTLRCFIWLLDLCIAVKLVLPLPGPESGAGLAGCWTVALAWTMWRNPVGILAVLQHMCKLQLQRHNLDNAVRVGFIQKANGTCCCTSHFHHQPEDPIPIQKYICLGFFLRKQPPQVYFSAFSRSGWNEPYSCRKQQRIETQNRKSQQLNMDHCINSCKQGYVK